MLTSIPYQLGKNSLVEKIAEAAKDKRIEGVSDIRDESSRLGVRVVIDLKRDATPEVVLNQLWRHTPAQSSFPANMLAIRGGRLIDGMRAEKGRLRSGGDGSDGDSMSAKGSPPVEATLAWTYREQGTFATGAHTVKFQQLVVNSTASGPVWPASGWCAWPTSGRPRTRSRWSRPSPGWWRPTPRSTCC